MQSAKPRLQPSRGREGGLGGSAPPRPNGLCMHWDCNADQWYLGEPDLCGEERGRLLLRASTSYVLDRWTLTINWSI